MTNPDKVYSDAVQAIAAGELVLSQLIDAATILATAGKSLQSTSLYRAWIKANDGHPLMYVALFNCAALEGQIGDGAELIESLKRAIQLNQDFLPAYINLGSAVERLGDPIGAIEVWRSAVNRPLPISGSNVTHVTTLLKQMTRVLVDQQQIEAAEQAVTQCLALGPSQHDAIEQCVSFRLEQCKWPVIESSSVNDSKPLLRACHPLSASAYTDDPYLHLGVADRCVRSASAAAARIGQFDRRHAPIDVTKRRLRVGYVSSDLRDHAVGYLMVELFELHDKSKIEVFAYYTGPKSDSQLTRRTMKAVEHWRDVRNFSDAAIAKMVADDGVDILIDVNGHTRFSRLGVFMERPAPIQVNWLGYPGTMGSPFHHYIIADEWIIPKRYEKFYSERVMRLPCYQPNDRKREVGPCPTREEVGLPPDAMVYCSFNGTHKITRFTFDRWMEILRRSQDSVLWLLAPSPTTQQRLQSYAERQGVDAKRLIFAPKLKNSYHLARYPLADLFLDTSPYGAHTTASDALWMGVPILTYSGRSFASRVCGSLVRAAGLPEMVAESLEEYVATAVRLGRNMDELRSYRARLIESRDTSFLFDTNLLVRHLERVFEVMCVEYASGLLPTPDLTNLEIYLDAGADHDHESHEVASIPDYDAHYAAKLAARHLARPISADRRAWTHDCIETVERAFAMQLANGSVLSRRQVNAKVTSYDRKSA